MSEEILDLPEFLERVQDDKELLLELLDIFSEDYVGKRKKLEEAVNAKDFEQLKSVGHSLKGASGNISAKALREIFLKFEEMGKTQNLDGAGNLLKALDEQYKKLQGRIAEVKQENS